MYDEVALAIFLSLPLDTALSLPGAKCIKDIYITHCNEGMQTVENLLSKWHVDYSSSIFTIPYNTAVNLVSWLHDERTHDPFARACCVLRWTARDLPMSGLMLQGIQALAFTLKQVIPEAARVFFEGLQVGGGKGGDLKDVPMSFILPQYDEVKELLADEEEERSSSVDGASAMSSSSSSSSSSLGSNNRLGAELGRLIARWNAMSLR